MGSLDSVAETVLHRRYLQQNEEGTVVETSDEMFHRVASNLATAEAEFGGDADAADTIDWEESVWSENPAFPPTTVAPETPLLVDGDRSVSHGAALAAAAEVADVRGLDGDSRVVLRSSLAEPGAVVAGLLAPLLVGGCAVLSDPATTAGAPGGDLAVTSGDAPEPERIDPEEVPLSGD